MEKRDTTIKPYKILIVDDDPLVIKALERLLFKRNYLFYSINSGEEALETVNDINPDIILLDVYMKGLTGFEVCSQLKKMGITKRIPVIFLTSNNQTSEIVKGFQSGAVDYIIKPFNTEELLARLLTHLELKKAREEIKNINMIKERFFSIMTHDINDALTGVKGVAEFLNQELKQSEINIDEIKKLSALLLDDSTQLYKFVQNLIKWDNIESDSMPEQPNKINAKELTEQITRQYAQAINSKNILIHNKVAQNIELYTHPSMLEDIFNELISNAVKYSEPGGIISIDMVKEKNLTIIQIEDQGVGMDKDVAENVFKLDTPHPKTIGTQNEKGIGLGLIICYTLVKKLNGTIKIQSEKHKGARIIIHLPDWE
jgi:two-component system, sensor histidine kinase and response regulator